MSTITRPTSSTMCPRRRNMLNLLLRVLTPPLWRALADHDRVPRGCAGRPEDFLTIATTCQPPVPKIVTAGTTSSSMMRPRLLHRLVPTGGTTATSMMTSFALRPLRRPPRTRLWSTCDRVLPRRRPHRLHAPLPNPSRTTREAQGGRHDQQRGLPHHPSRTAVTQAGTSPFAEVLMPRQTLTSSRHSRRVCRNSWLASPRPPLRPPRPTRRSRRPPEATSVTPRRSLATRGRRRRGNPGPRGPGGGTAPEMTWTESSASSTKSRRSSTTLAANQRHSAFITSSRV